MLYKKVEIEFSTLQWNIEKCAQKILWDFQLPLFSRALLDEGEINAAILGLSHFTEKLLSHYPSVGAILYTGPLREEVIEVCRELRVHLPDDLPIYVHVTNEMEWDLALLAEVTEEFRVLIRPFPHLHALPIWQALSGELFFYPQQPWPKALLVSKSHSYAAVLPFLEKEMRLISEERLEQCWEGLEELVVPYTPSPLIERKLQGFLASGGKLTTVPRGA